MNAFRQSLQHVLGRYRNIKFDIRYTAGNAARTQALAKS